MKIKKGDVVQVLTGKDRGKQGEVMTAIPAQGKVIVTQGRRLFQQTRPLVIPTKVRIQILGRISPLVPPSLAVSMSVKKTKSPTAAAPP